MKALKNRWTCFLGLGFGFMVAASAEAAPISVNFAQSTEIESGFTLDFGFGPGGISSALVSDTNFELEIDPIAGTARFVTYSQNVEELFLPTPNGLVGTGEITIEIVASLGGTFDRETGEFSTNDVYAVHFTGDLSAFGIESPFLLPSASSAAVEYDSPNTGTTNLVWDGESEIGGTAFRYTCDVSGDFDSSNTTVYLTASSPANGTIDARQPNDLFDADEAMGFDSFDIGFNAEPFTTVTAADFLVSEWGADTAPPAVASVTEINGGTGVRIELEEPIDPVAWTSFTHAGSGTSLCVAALPGDVNGDRVSDGTDVLALTECMNGTCEPHQADIDRNGVVDPEDILTVIDLLNGGSEFDVFHGATLGASPCS
ncbi:MAG: dockerin type I domain-containing protein [Planctomycetota bacterium]|jgi:hypothetical protein